MREGLDLERLVEWARAPARDRILDIATGGGHTAVARLALAQDDHRRAPATALGRGVEVTGYTRMRRQKRLDDSPLDPPPSPVDQPDFGKAAAAGLIQVLGHHRWDVSRREGVEI